MLLLFHTTNIRLGLLQYFHLRYRYSFEFIVVFIALCKFLYLWAYFCKYFLFARRIPFSIFWNVFQLGTNYLYICLFQMSLFFLHFWILHAWNSTMPFYIAEVYSIPLFCSVPIYEYTLIYLANPLIMDIWFVSGLGLLWGILLWTSAMNICAHTISISVGIYIDVE